jgi:hypothetical protein
MIAAPGSADAGWLVRIARQQGLDHELEASWRRRPAGRRGAILALALLALVLPASLAIGAAALAASHGQGPAASATRPHSKPCGKAHSRHCHWMEINSFSFGEGRGITNPTHGAAGREGSAASLGEITVHKPKPKVH